MEEGRGKLIEIGALWVLDSGKGFKGSLGRGGATILVLKNERKSAENQPDYRLLVAPYDKREKTDGGEDVPF